MARASDQRAALHAKHQSCPESSARVGGPGGRGRTDTPCETKWDSSTVVPVPDRSRPEEIGNARRSEERRQEPCGRLDPVAQRRSRTFGPNGESDRQNIPAQTCSKSAWERAAIRSPIAAAEAPALSASAARSTPTSRPSRFLTSPPTSTVSMSPGLV